jgi:hypothetical protein
MIGVNLKIVSLTTKTMFFLIDAMPSYNVLLGRD